MITVIIVVVVFLAFTAIGILLDIRNNKRPDAPSARRKRP